MNTDQIFRMMKGGFLLLLIVLFSWLVFTTVGCASTETVYERVPVPMPYWSPPEDIAPPPPRPNLQAGDVSREEAEADPRQAFRLLGQDLAAVLAWGERLDFLYAELVKLIEFEPPAPPHPGDPE